MVPRLLALLGGGFVVVSPKQASDPSEAGSPVERSQGDRTGLRCGSRQGSKRREQKPGLVGTERAWAGPRCERQALGRVIVPGFPVHPWLGVA